MRLDSGVLLRQTERGSVDLTPGQPQPGEQPGLHMVRTGLQDRAREQERARDSDAPSEAVLSARLRLRGVGLRQGHGRQLHVQGDLVGGQGQAHRGGEQGESVSSWSASSFVT